MFQIDHFFVATTVLILIVIQLSTMALFIGKGTEVDAAANHLNYVQLCLLVKKTI